MTDTKDGAGDLERGPPLRFVSIPIVRRGGLRPVRGGSTGSLQCLGGPLPRPLPRKRERGELLELRRALSHAAAAPLPPPSPRCAVGGSLFYRAACIGAREIQWRANLSRNGG